jgi:hypothetical protein
LTSRTRSFVCLPTSGIGIHNGELTERGFARMIGISQPHVHYVLKGVRTLSIEIADSILNILHLSILDLASPEDLGA